ncbi:hypothetical protein BJX76DRAFT_359388 [Aspergillus varians]
MTSCITDAIKQDYRALEGGYNENAQSQNQFTWELAQLAMVDKDRKERYGVKEKPKKFQNMKTLLNRILDRPLNHSGLISKHIIEEEAEHPS